MFGYTLPWKVLKTHESQCDDFDVFLDSWTDDLWRWQISAGCLCSYVCKISKQKIKNIIYIDNLEHVGHTQHSLTQQTLVKCEWIVLQEIYLSKEADTRSADWGNVDQHILPKLMTSSKFFYGLPRMLSHFTLWSQFFPHSSKCEHVSLP